MIFIHGAFNKINKKLILDSASLKVIESDRVSVGLQGNIVGCDDTDKATKYISRVYRTRGLDYLLRNLNGSYNIIIVDKERAELHVFCDRYGSRPLFIYESKSDFVFGSHVSAVLSYLDHIPSPNWRGLAQYLTFRFTLGENTFYESIKLIDNGVCYTANLLSGDISENNYWSYNELQIDNGKNFEAKVSEGVEVFRKTFTTLAKDIGSKKFIVGLSGGYDSRSIVAGLRSFGCLTFDTITTLHPCGPEGAIAHELSSELGINNIYIERPEDIYTRYYLEKNIFTDFLVQEHLWAMPMISTIKGYDAYVDGIAGDIIMRSTRVRPIHLAKYNDPICLSKLFKKQFGFEYTWLEEYVDPSVWSDIEYDESWIVDEFKKIGETSLRMDVFLMKNRVRNGISLSSNNALGSNVTQVYQPFFDTALLEFGMTMPHKYKFDFIYRQILDSTYPNIAHIVSSSDETKEKLAKYDKKIIDFESNPRELVSDYANISKKDIQYMENLLRNSNEVAFLDTKRFLNDYKDNPQFHRLTTMLDLHTWWDNTNKPGG